ncbi:hypothetical protein FJ661_00180 [Pseudarthrobacter phenanthrenivorans]|uniref:DUF6993 domain-containing protein n=1 Tax=Pseudarthrobacter phenanthrenivorans TaxID=361575 RepID=UPI00112CCBF5|nr:hypothetical protein [Pseudarthrobacter phenanthrenivorans]TPV53065.1 hypothetical protein FJ661_00180 [Pseudarthrobacter phenanthrenivorans]
MWHTLDNRQTATAGALSVALPAPLSGTRFLLRATAGRLAATVAGVALVFLLSGCSVAAPSGSPAMPADPSPAATSSAGNGAAPATGGNEPLADTSTTTGAAATERAKQTVTDALGRLAAGAPKPSTAQVSDALTGAGIAPGSMEVSQSRTPTGLEADAIEAAVLQGRDCVIAQVRDGAVAVTVLPVLASGKCFVGS